MEPAREALRQSEERLKDQEGLLAENHQRLTAMRQRIVVRAVCVAWENTRRKVRVSSACRAGPVLAAAGQFPDTPIHKPAAT